MTFPDQLKYLLCEYRAQLEILDHTLELWTTTKEQTVEHAPCANGVQPTINLNSSTVAHTKDKLDSPIFSVFFAAFNT